ncbi:MAG: hypothetical protein KBB86_02710 [Candidatus Pacebacteria bacterium]|nr:hypothetical protein [Candidatus Paceibacterota bacterium]
MSYRKIETTVEYFDASSDSKNEDRAEWKARSRFPDLKIVSVFVVSTKEVGQSPFNSCKLLESKCVLLVKGKEEICTEQNGLTKKPVSKNKFWLLRLLGF